MKYFNDSIDSFFKILSNSNMENLDTDFGIECINEDIATLPFRMIMGTSIDLDSKLWIAVFIADKKIHMPRLDSRA
jgi:hypothetical protein